MIGAEGTPLAAVMDREIQNPNSTISDGAAEVLDRRRRSWNWLKASYWPEFINVYQSYKGERDAETDPNDSAKKDETQTSIAMPDTWALVRRMVARVTAQPPSLKFRADDEAIANRISRALMYQWDRGGVQKFQKRHVTQASLFGWSVRPWSWVIDEYNRKRRVNPLDPQYHEEIFKQYGDKIAEYSQGVPPEQMQDPQFQLQLTARLVGDVGRGSLIPIQYLYKCYEGPKTEFLFIGDCYPEPNFQTIQTSNWFIVERRRNREWVERFIKAYGDKYPEIKAGFANLLRQFPNGSPRTSQGKILQQLRSELLAVSNRSDVLTGMDTGIEAIQEWTIVEMHVPGQNASISYVGEENVWIGKIPYPYELDGKIAFTELTFIDDILSGIGDSNARVLRGLQELHSRQACQRMDLIYNVLRPLMWTRDRKLYDNPDLLKRGPGFRLMFSDQGQAALGVLGEQAALAAAAASLNDESSIMRAYQMGSGESNMSNQANVDPQQNRTATGARIMAFNSDILTKDQVDKFTETSLKPDLEMMYLLNRSELTEPIAFSASKYNRQYTSSQPVQGQQPSPDAGPDSSAPPQQDDIMTATPEDFQYDGEVEVEAGSTLADDDDSKVTKAQSLMQAALGAPQLFNVQAAAQDFLIALGKGRELQKYMAGPPPPPPHPEPKGSLSMAAKLEMFNPEVQAKMLSSVGVEVTPEEIMNGMVPPPGMPPQQDGPGGPPPVPGGPPPPMGGPPMPPMPPMPPEPPRDQVLAAQSLAAARGNNPMRPK